MSGQYVGWDETQLRVQTSQPAYTHAAGDWIKPASPSFSEGMRSSKQVLGASTSSRTSRGPWTPEEDDALRELVRKYGAEKWTQIATYMKSRSRKQCRERWHNHLDPSIIKTPWTAYEADKIRELYALNGGKWAEMAKHLPGRPDNSIKNYFNTHLAKQFQPKGRSKKERSASVSTSSTDLAQSSAGGGSPKMSRGETVTAQQARFAPYARGGSSSAMSRSKSEQGQPRRLSNFAPLSASTSRVSDDGNYSGAVVVPSTPSSASGRQSSQSSSLKSSIAPLTPLNLAPRDLTKEHIDRAAFSAPILFNDNNNASWTPPMTPDGSMVHPVSGSLQSPMLEFPFNSAMPPSLPASPHTTSHPVYPAPASAAYASYPLEGGDQYHETLAQPAWNNDMPRQRVSPSPSTNSNRYSTHGSTTASFTSGSYAGDRTLTADDGSYVESPMYRSGSFATDSQASDTSSMYASGGFSADNWRRPSDTSLSDFTGQTDVYLPPSGSYGGPHPPAGFPTSEAPVCQLHGFPQTSPFPAPEQEFSNMHLHESGGDQHPNDLYHLSVTTLPTTVSAPPAPPPPTDLAEPAQPQPMYPGAHLERSYSHTAVPHSRTPTVRPRASTLSSLHHHDQQPRRRAHQHSKSISTPTQAEAHATWTQYQQHHEPPHHQLHLSLPYNSHTLASPISLPPGGAAPWPTAPYANDSNAYVDDRVQPLPTYMDQRAVRPVSVPAQPSSSATPPPTSAGTVKGKNPSRNFWTSIVRSKKNLPSTPEEGSRPATAHPTHHLMQVDDSGRAAFTP